MSRPEGVGSLSPGVEKQRNPSFVQFQFRIKKNQNLCQLIGSKASSISYIKLTKELNSYPGNQINHKLNPQVYKINTKLNTSRCSAV